MTVGEAYAAGTIVNAVATGKGCAFAINLKTRVEFDPGDKVEILERNRKIRSRVVERILREHNIKGKVQIFSEIPARSGLGSSSALVNALLIALYKARNLNLDALKILEENARISLEAKISYTGAFDDAAASLLGGIVLTDNFEMKILKRDSINCDALILMPDSKKKRVEVKEVRKNTKMVECAFREAMQGEYMLAMLYNSLHYCTLLGYSMDPVLDARKIGITAGLSGNGPAYVAFGVKRELKKLSNRWKRYGKVIYTNTVSKPCDELIGLEG
jgi:shikimate kinase